MKKTIVWFRKDLRIHDNPALWQVPLDVLQKVDIQLGKTYPFPIIDHSFARKRVLEAFATVKTNI